MSRHTSRTSLIHHLNRRKSPSVQCYRRSVFSRRSKRCRYIFTGVPVGSSVSSTRGLLIISLISSVVLLFGILHASYVEDVDLISDQGISVPEQTAVVVIHSFLIAVAREVEYAGAMRTAPRIKVS